MTDAAREAADQYADNEHGDCGTPECVRLSFLQGAEWRASQPVTVSDEDARFTPQEQDAAMEAVLERLQRLGTAEVQRSIAAGESLGLEPLAGMAAVLSSCALEAVAKRKAASND